VTAPLDQLRDKVALVTGGASGIGHATALALAEAGAELVIADVDEDGGRAVASRVGGHFVRTDVSDLDANRAMVELAVREAGGVDLAFLNAGIATGCGIGDDFDLERYRRAMGVNLDGVVFGTHAVLPAPRARGGGAIVATSSLAGLTGVPLEPIYSANKHAVVGFVRAVGPALAVDGIRVNAVCPGFAESALTAPMRDALIAAGFELLEAEDVASVVVDLFAGDAAGECWFVQPGRAAAFEFRHVPGPRKTPEKERH
jgi:NAD(P)-dependent dehydrogenase (short-subunit alcohol dehydrogenase family)